MLTITSLAATLVFLSAANALPNGYKQPSTVQHQPYPTPTTAPTPTPTPEYNVFSYNANFDDIAAIPVVGADVQSIGVYDSLFYQGFNLDATLDLGDINLGVVPNSPPQYAVFAPQNMATAGPIMMTVDYPDSTIEFFHLSSFYYGCTLNTENSDAGMPTSCTITITGYDVDGTTVAGPQSFAFVGAGTSQQQQLAIVESSFQQNKVYNIVFVLAGADGDTDLIGAVVDTMKYTVYGSGAITGNSK